MSDYPRRNGKPWAIARALSGRNPAHQKPEIRDSFVSIARHVSQSNVEGRRPTVILMSTLTWLDLHMQVQKTPTTDPNKNAGHIMAVPIRIDDEIRGVRYVY